MSKIKSTERTTKRIISMVESGDYDPATIQHMIDSIVANHERRIEQLKKKVKPREFSMTLKVVTGALQSCINEHGPISSKWIGSAAKRIYGNCQRVADEKLPVVRTDNPTISVVYDQTTVHKLTVARDGNVRIKIAKGSTDVVGDHIIEVLKKVAVKALELNMGTLRGRVDKSDLHNKITLYTNSEKEHVTFTY